MLYDRRWDKPDPVRDAFIAFLRKQPADRGYMYHSFNHCACAQYCRQTRRLLDWFWYYGKRVEHEREIWYRFDHIASIRPNTFGALLARMEALRSGETAHCTGSAYGSDASAVTCP